MGPDALTRRREAERDRYLEGLERLHPAVKPCLRVGPPAVRQARARANVLYTQRLHAAHPIVKPRILDVKRLLDANMIRWIQRPQDVDPKNVMPNMGVTDQDARDIAAYLYTLRQFFDSFPICNPTHKTGGPEAPL